MRGGAAIDADAVQITFKRRLPVNEVEVAQMLGALEGLVPKEILIGQVPFVEDARGAMELLGKESERAIIRSATEGG